MPEQTTTTAVRLSLRQRIFLGFAAVLALLASVVLLGVFSLEGTQQTFNDFARVSNESAEILQIDNTVSELQRAVLLFSHTGHQGALNRVRSAHRLLTEKLATLNQQWAATEDPRAVTLIEMAAILNSYGSRFDDLEQSRAFRDAIINSEMQALIERIERDITLLLEASARKDNARVAAEYGLIEQDILQAQAEALYFFNNRDASLRKKATANIDKALAMVNFIDLDIKDPELRQLNQSITRLLPEYRNAFFRAVQATRDYLFLVNVVMAGEAAEFTLLSASLKNSTLELLQSLTDEKTEAVASSRRLLTLSSVGAIGFGVLLAILLGRSISSPIRQMAHTLNLLAAGDQSAQIPGLERDDEIGQMAEAADIFKQTNLRTERLLQETQRLAADLRAREHELEEQAKELERSNAELDNFAYVASHDLKSPLRAIDNLSRWLEEDCASLLPDESRAHLLKMRQRVKRMENLLADLLNYSRAGRVAEEAHTVRISQVVNSAVELAELPPHIEVAPLAADATITTLTTPLQQVFLNLLTNAAKYHDKASGTIHISIEPIDEQWMECAVSDDGPGIAPEYHDRIFQMFQTLQARDVMEGSGMGLAIIKKLVEHLGGRIWVESAPGQGATFRFTWPTRLDQPQPLSEIDDVSS